MRDRIYPDQADRHVFQMMRIFTFARSTTLDPDLVRNRVVTVPRVPQLDDRVKSLNPGLTASLATLFDQRRLTGTSLVVTPDADGSDTRLDLQSLHVALEATAPKACTNCGSDSLSLHPPNCNSWISLQINRFYGSGRAAACDRSTCRVEPINL